MFLRCHDLKNVLETIASSKDATLMSVHLNHNCMFYFARNILILKVISATEFDVNNIEDISYVWDLWCNVKWPKSTLQRFIEDVENLIKGLPKNCSGMKACQKEELKATFSDWLETLKTRLTKSLEIEKILKERLVIIMYCYVYQFND